MPEDNFKIPKWKTVPMTKDEAKDIYEAMKVEQKKYVENHFKVK